MNDCSLFPLFVVSLQVQCVNDVFVAFWPKTATEE